MKVLEIGENFSTSTTVNYLEPINLLEYDLVFVDLTALTAQGTSYTAVSFNKRRKNFEDFIRLKGIPVVYFMPPPREYSYLFIETGRFDKKSYDFFAPIPKLNLEVLSGQEMNLVGTGPLSDLFKKYIAHFEYKSYCIDRPGKVVLETPLTKHPLAFYDNEYLFIPAGLRNFHEMESQFFEDLLEALQQLKIKQTYTQEELPQWAEIYMLPGEVELNNKATELTNQIAELQEKLQVANEEHSLLVGFKTIFTSSGNQLEKIVETLFQEFGFEILRSDDNRDDLIMRYDDKISVVEIKGVKGGAAEKYAAQLEKWAANYLADNNIKPKSILVVNAFRESPLNERPGEVFPHSMQDYSIKRDHCLISTLQLLGMYYYLKQHPEQKEHLIKRLLNTVGEFDQFKDWKEFIEYAQ